jgi:hypothetical protein
MLIDSNDVAFDNTEDRLILEKAMMGIVDCSCLASNFGFTTVLDYIIMSLAKLSGLNKTNQVQSPRSMASNLSSHTTMSSRHAVSDFGRSSKSQLSCLLLFSISKECANSMVEGWTHVSAGCVFLLSVY